MKKYYCISCNYHAKQKSNYERHLKTKKHRLSTFCQQKTVKCQHFDNTCQHLVNNYRCKYCLKSFTTRQSMYRHIKYTCKNNKDEDFKELVKLMNEKLCEQNTVIETMETQIEKRDKQIIKLRQKLQINNIQNIQNNTNNNNIHVHLNSYKNTDLSVFNDADFVDCLKKYKNCVVKAIEKIHLNPEYPQNMNLYISNIKENYMMMFDDGKWTLKDRNKELQRIYEDKEEILDEWVETKKSIDPNIIRMFNRYLELKETNDTLIKDLLKDVKMMIYNNKEKICYHDLEKVNETIELLEQGNNNCMDLDFNDD